MKLVREHINFKRGENPHKSLKVGKYRDFVVGDELKLKMSIYWDVSETEWVEYINGTDVITLYKDDILDLYSIDDNILNIRVKGDNSKKYWFHKRQSHLFELIG